MKPNKQYQVAINHLWKALKSGEYDSGMSVRFEFPNYCGLPKRIIGTLTSEQVDAIQDLMNRSYNNKREFTKMYSYRMEIVRLQNAIDVLERSIFSKMHPPIKK